VATDTNPSVFPLQSLNASRVGPATRLCLLFAALAMAAPSWSSTGTEGASFLDLPVGARPVAMGSAYAALATDAYAPTYNPAGLGFVKASQLAGMHQIYVEDTSFEFASFVHPLSGKGALGAAIQYFMPGSLTGRDANGNPIGDISGSYGAYSLAYGQALSEQLSLGVAGKLIHASIDGISGNAYGGDVGVMYRPDPRLQLAGVIDNAGTQLTFLQDSDSLPLSGHLGMAYRPRRELTLAAEGVYRKSGPSSGEFGAEWMNDEGFSLRAGYDTQRIKELTPLAGVSVGVGLSVWGQEISYAWVPLGDFGSSHYFSLVFRFGAHAKSLEDENLMAPNDLLDDHKSLMNEMMGPDDQDDSEMNSIREME